MDTRVMHWGVLLPLLAWALPAPAAVFTDDFAAGLNASYWVEGGDLPLYTIDASQGDVRISKPYGGSYTFQSGWIQFRRPVVGNFDVRVDFRNASITRVDGSPGNQVQLNTYLPQQVLCLVRSDEVAGGNNYHVWAGPPSAWFGASSTSALNGTMRIARVGSHVSFYFNGALFFENDYNSGPVGIALTLQNNGTKDATAVTFDNFYLAADGIGLHPGDANADGKVSVGDLGILAANYGATNLDPVTSWSKGDFTDDAKVSVGDLGILAANYGWTDSVPEPLTLGLLAAGGLLLLRRRQACRHCDRNL